MSLLEQSNDEELLPIEHPVHSNLEELETPATATRPPALDSAGRERGPGAGAEVSHEPITIDSPARDSDKRSGSPGRPSEQPAVQKCSPVEADRGLRNLGDGERLPLQHGVNHGEQDQRNMDLLGTAGQEIPNEAQGTGSPCLSNAGPADCDVPRVEETPSAQPESYQNTNASASAQSQRPANLVVSTFKNQTLDVSVSPPSGSNEAQSPFECSAAPTPSQLMSPVSEGSPTAWSGILKRMTEAQSETNHPRKRHQAQNVAQADEGFWKRLISARHSQGQGIDKDMQRLMEQCANTLSKKALSRSQAESPGLIEQPRFELLRKACGAHDHAFLMIHQLFCHSTLATLGLQASRLSKEDIAALNTLDSLLASNSHIHQDMVMWFSTFPGPSPAIVSAVSPDVGVGIWQRATLSTVHKIAAHWGGPSGLQTSCKERRWPPLVGEMQDTMHVFSQVLQEVMFTSMLRMLMSENDFRYHLHQEVFKRDLQITWGPGDGKDGSNLICAADHRKISMLKAPSRTPLTPSVPPPTTTVNTHLESASTRRHSSSAAHSTHSAQQHRHQQLQEEHRQQPQQEQQLQSYPQQHLRQQLLQQRQPHQQQRRPQNLPSTSNGSSQMQCLDNPVGTSYLSQATQPSPLIMRASASNGRENGVSGIREAGEGEFQLSRPSYPDFASHMTPASAIVLNDHGLGRVQEHLASTPTVTSLQLSQQQRSNTSTAHTPTIPSSRPSLPQTLNARVAHAAPNNTHSDHYTLNPYTNFPDNHHRLVGTQASLPWPHICPLHQTNASSLHRNNQQYRFSSYQNKLDHRSGHKERASSPPIETSTPERCFRYIRTVYKPMEILSATKLQYQQVVDLKQKDIDARPRNGNTTLLFPGSLTFRVRCVKLPQRKTGLADEQWVCAEHCWPARIALLFNGQSLNIKRKSGHGKDFPVDVTYLVRPGHNVLSVAAFDMSRNGLDQYIVGVEAIETLTYSQIKGIDHTIPLEVAKKRITDRTGNGDADIQFLDPSITVDLTDPFSSTIFVIPARGVGCVHDQCFDLDTFLSTRMGSGGHRNGPCPPEEFRCPICKGDARPPKIVVDGFLLHVRRKLHAIGRLDVKAIKVDIDGNWTIKEEAPGAEDDSPADGSDEMRKDLRIKNDPDEQTIPRAPKPAQPIEVIELD